MKITSAVIGFQPTKDLYHLFLNTWKCSLQTIRHSFSLQLPAKHEDFYNYIYFYVLDVFTVVTAS